MAALEVLQCIVNNKYLSEADLKYCYMTAGKVPYNGTKPASPSNVNDFVDLIDLDLDCIDQFEGIGISVQASKICAIDIDHCVKNKFDITSLDDRVKDILNIFKGYYAEFSFSGNGIRILFKAEPIQDYVKKYKIKNSNNGCEYYYPEGGNRYVSITGRNITEENIKTCPESTILEFLDKYMVRPKTTHSKPKNEIKQGIPEQKLKHFLRSDISFQNNWFEAAPGSGSDESERDYFLIKFIYDNITSNKQQVKEMFESSPFFKSKDYKHINKWNYNDFRYFEYIWSRL